MEKKQVEEIEPLKEDEIILSEREIKARLRAKSKKDLIRMLLQAFQTIDGLRRENK